MCCSPSSRIRDKTLNDDNARISVRRVKEITQDASQIAVFPYKAAHERSRSSVLESPVQQLFADVEANGVSGSEFPPY